MAAALPDLTGPRWAKVRRALARPQLWTYLDRAHEQLAALPVAAELREAAVQVEGLRRRPEGLRGEGPSAGGPAWRAVGRGAGAVAGRAGGCGGAGAGARGAGWGVACEQPGGGDQQRAADAAGTSPEDDAGAAGPEAAVLELPSLPYGQAAAAEPVRVAGCAVAVGAVVGVTEVVAGATATRTCPRPRPPSGPSESGAASSPPERRQQLSAPGVAA